MAAFFALNLRPFRAASIDSILPFLTQSRAEKVLRFHDVDDAWRCALSELLLKWALKTQYEYALTAPWQTNPQGKPFIADAPCQFSITHAGEWVAVALAEQTVGTDIEPQRPMKRLLPLARRFFTQTEADRISDAQDPITAFFATWTQKESYLKCIGTGISGHMKTLTVPAAEQTPILTDLFSFHYFTPTPGVHAAVCIQGYEDLTVNELVNGARLIEDLALTIELNDEE